MMSYFNYFELSITIIVLQLCGVNWCQCGRYKETEDISRIKNNFIINESKVQSDVNVGDKVEIKLFYESLCECCKEFDTTVFLSVVQKLHDFLNVYTNPYGNSKTYVDKYGKYTFKCQHGEKECYGNKLHACALNVIQNQMEALLYNSCMMNDTKKPGSDDSAADKCGSLLNQDSEAIKTCAKGDQGSKLLKKYGDESRDVKYQYVPFVLINGKEFNLKEDFLKAVCAAIKAQPLICK